MFFQDYDPSRHPHIRHIYGSRNNQEFDDLESNPAQLKRSQSHHLFISSDKLERMFGKDQNLTESNRDGVEGAITGNRERLLGEERRKDYRRMNLKVHRQTLSK